MPKRGKEEPPAFTLQNQNGTSRYVLICEHASRFIPGRYEGLGLGPQELESHIAWDIGAQAVAERLSRLIDAPLVTANYSRLLIDLNRPVQSGDLIPEVSEITPIPGNKNISAGERTWRIEALFNPFQERVKQLLDDRLAAGIPTIVIGVHSFTPVFKGERRPWVAGILYRKATRLGNQLVTVLGGDAAGVASNQPYGIEDTSDYTVPVHGEARGLDAVLLEIRQDLIHDAGGADIWAVRLARGLLAVA